MKTESLNADTLKELIADLPKTEEEIKKAEENEKNALDAAISWFTKESKINEYLYDYEVNFDVSKYHSFHVTELEFEKQDDFQSAFINDNDQTKVVKEFQNLALYCLARNYRIRDEPYEHLIANLNKEALSEYFACDEQLRLKNLLQSNRVFISMGRRGAVIAYAKNHDHPQARTSTLIMIDILRGRMHNLIVSQTLIDNAIRDLAKLALMSQNGKDVNGKEVEEVRKKVLTNMMQAHKIFGLVVSDPGVYLLDGSVLSRMSGLADEYFHLSALKENVERKMNAMQRFWTEYQDQQREHIIANFVK